MDPAIPRPSTGSVGCSSVLPSLPVVSTPEGSPSSRAAPMDQCLLWSGSSFGGESAGASPHIGESDADGGGARVSQTFLERALLMFTRAVRTRCIAALARWHARVSIPDDIV